MQHCNRNIEYNDIAQGDIFSYLRLTHYHENMINMT